MFHYIFGAVELFGIVGLVRAVLFLQHYCLTHKWTKHDSEKASWTLSLGYGVVALVLFWLAYALSNSIYVLLFGISHSGGIVTFGLGALLAFLVTHMLVGGFFLAGKLASLITYVHDKKQVLEQSKNSSATNSTTGSTTTPPTTTSTTDTAAPKDGSKQ